MDIHIKYKFDFIYDLLTVCFMTIILCLNVMWLFGNIDILN